VASFNQRIEGTSNYKQLGNSQKGGQKGDQNSNYKSITREQGCQELQITAHICELIELELDGELTKSPEKLKKVVGINIYVVIYHERQPVTKIF